MVVHSSTSLVNNFHFLIINFKIDSLTRDPQLVLSTTSNPKGITWIRGSNVKTTTSILQWKARLVTRIGTEEKTSLLKSIINVNKEALGKKSMSSKCKVM